MTRSAIVWVLALLVLVGTLARAEDKADPVAEHKTFLASLPKDDPASITKAIDQYRTAIVPLNADRRTRAFLDFLTFHQEACVALAESIWQKMVNLKTTDTGETAYDHLLKSKEYLELKDYGLEFASDGMGGLYVRDIPEHIPSVFLPYLPKSIKRFLELRSAEMREGYESDAVLDISYARLAQRVADWDAYVRNYENSPLLTEALTLRASYLRDLLFGLDNSPFDPKTEDRSNNIRIVYEDFLRANSGTYTAKFVRAQYDYLKKEGFFSKTFAGDPREIPRGRHAEVKACMDRTINLDTYWLYMDSGYRVGKKSAKSVER